MSRREVLSLLRENESFVIGTHLSPDGDALGSMTALAVALTSLGKKVRLVVADSLPSRYGFLPYYGQIAQEFPLPVPEDVQVLIAVDCGSWERLSAPVEYKKNVTVANIDHHRDNELFGHCNWVNPQAAAVGEMIYDCVEDLKMELTPEIALGLYTAIMTDTGGFLYANTTARTHEIAARLLNTGIDHSLAAEKALEERSFSELKLLARVLTSAAVEDGVGWMELSAGTLRQYGLELQDVKDLVNYIRSVQEVKIAALFTETDDGTIKVSLRSKDPYDVSILASKFHGGGHPRAAGCRLKCSLAEAKERVLSAAMAMVRS